MHLISQYLEGRGSEFQASLVPWHSMFVAGQPGHVYEIVFQKKSNSNNNKLDNSKGKTKNIEQILYFSYKL